MNQKLFLFDVDGTLVEQDSEAAPSTAVCDALRELRYSGHTVFLCTGRTLCDIGPELYKADFDGIIAGVGTDIRLHGKQIYKRPVPMPLLRETVDRVIAAGVTGLFSGPDSFYYAGHGSRVLPWDFPRLESGRELKPEMEIQKFSIYVRDPEELEPLLPFLNCHYEHYLSADGRFCELVQKGSGKAGAILWLCSHLGIDLRDTVGFGDSANDISMFRIVGSCVAMGNAPDFVKQCADYIAGSVTADGVASALKALGYIRGGGAM